MNTNKNNVTTKTKTNETARYILHSIEDFNTFQRPYAEALPQAVNKQECTRIKESCCLKCNRPNSPKGCVESECWLYHNYMFWYGVMGDGPRIIYKNMPKQKRKQLSRGYEISKHKKCGQRIGICVSKLLSKTEFANNAALLKIREQLQNRNKNGSVKMASIKEIGRVAAKYKFDKIADIVDKFIIKGKLGADNSENK